MQRLQRLHNHMAAAASQAAAAPAAPAPAADAASAPAAAGSAIPPQLQADRIRGALYGMFIGDALAVPAHWYYDRDQLVADYGEIGHESYTLKKIHPGSFLVRMEYAPPAGADILHGEASKYNAGAAYHFHPALAAGENTLNLHIVRVLLRALVSACGRVDNEKFMRDYRHFMLSPGRHNNDSWADAALKFAFERWAEAGCAQDDGVGRGGLADFAVEESMVWSVSNVSPLLRTALIAMLLLGGGGRGGGGDNHSLAAVEQVARAHERLTHKAETLDRYRLPFVQLLSGLIGGAPAEPAAVGTANGLGLPALTGEQQRARYERLHKHEEGAVPAAPERAGDRMSSAERKRFHASQAAEAAPLGPALAAWASLPVKDVIGGLAEDGAKPGIISHNCYAEHAVPAALHLLHRHAPPAGTPFAGRAFAECVAENANCGGDCTNRGALLGLLAGAVCGLAALPRGLVAGLTAHAELEAEVEAFVALCC
eukprot:SAG22_NODE_1711_length_3758_cov_3.866630_1_plen_484_part_00